MSMPIKTTEELSDDFVLLSQKSELPKEGTLERFKLDVSISNLAVLEALLPVVVEIFKGK
jgi:hypothetical protein